MSNIGIRYLGKNSVENKISIDTVINGNNKMDFENYEHFEHAFNLHLMSFMIKHKM